MHEVKKNKRKMLKICMRHPLLWARRINFMNLPFREFWLVVRVLRLLWFFVLSLTLLMFYFVSALCWAMASNIDFNKLTERNLMMIKNCALRNVFHQTKINKNCENGEENNCFEIQSRKFFYVVNSKWFQKNIRKILLISSFFESY